MTTETVPLTFLCSICAEHSREICVACTKDACTNHRCARCKRCSDCCGCDAPLSEADAEVKAVREIEPTPLPVSAPLLELPPVLETAPEPEAEKELLEKEAEIELPSHESLPELFRPE